MHGHGQLMLCVNETNADQNAGVNWHAHGVGLWPSPSMGICILDELEFRCQDTIFSGQFDFRHA